MIYNLALHEHLIANGYAHQHVESTWEETGDAESGPCLDGGPAYDEYTSDDERVFASETGTLDRQARDLEFEAFCDQQISGMEGARP